MKTLIINCYRRECVNVFSLNILFDIFFAQLWIRVADGDLQDSTRSDLYEYVVDFLCSCSNLDLVWKYADWALQKDPIVSYHNI